MVIILCVPIFRIFMVIHKYNGSIFPSIDNNKTKLLFVGNNILTKHNVHHCPIVIYICSSFMQFCSDSSYGSGWTER